MDEARQTAAADIRPDTARPPKRTPARTSKLTPAADTTATVRAGLVADPDVTTGQLAPMTGVSDRTVRRVYSCAPGAV